LLATTTVTTVTVLGYHSCCTIIGQHCREHRRQSSVGLLIRLLQAAAARPILLTGSANRSPGLSRSLHKHSDTYITPINVDKAREYGVCVYMCVVCCAGSVSAISVSLSLSLSLSYLISLSLSLSVLDD